MSALPHHSPFALSTEEPWHDPAILALHRGVFGPGRFSRTAYRVRESIGHHRDLSMIARRDGRLVGSVRMTRVEIGSAPGVLLGPIAVSEDVRGEGLGTRLVAASLDRARGAAAGFVILVGDAAYYRKLGFVPVAHDRIGWPGPVDPDRVLVAVLSNETWAAARGPIVAVQAFSPALAKPREPEPAE